ncbi:hypothetical protein BBP40_011476 [Aspergillus hancockii]|nr:hypothetical protein BBP40_011476 [Aspergillus hancockii]
MATSTGLARFIPMIGYHHVLMIICAIAVALLSSIAKQKWAISGIGMNKTSEGTADPLNLIWIAKNFKETIVFDGLIFITIALVFIAILLMGTFPGWHEEISANGSEREVKPFPSRPVSQTALGCIGIASALGLISILWQHVNSSAAASMATSLTYGAIESHVGTAAMILGWAAVVLVGIATIALLVMILSISLIRQLTEED